MLERHDLDPDITRGEFVQIMGGVDPLTQTPRTEIEAAVYIPLIDFTCGLLSEGERQLARGEEITTLTGVAGLIVSDNIEEEIFLEDLTLK